MRTTCTLVISLALAFFARAARGNEQPVAHQRAFLHPGLLHSTEDLERIRKNVKAGVEPWAGAWKAFSGPQNRWLAKNYEPHPLEAAGRGVGSGGMNNISNDATAAYYNAVAWAVTGDEAYAKKSADILNAWSYTCRLINGKDAVLCAGIYGYKFLNAAEILRSTYPAWPLKDVEQFKIFATTVILPVVKDFAPFANGNWDAAAGATMISIGVFCDDRALFDRAVRYHLDGPGDGAVTHYVINDAGQLQESGRDQGHAQLGIGMLSLIAEVAWHQGVDLYGAFDNRLLKGFEYTAKYNLGEPVPFQAETDRTSQYTHVKISPRAGLGAVYEMVYNHYVNRAGVAAPYTARAAAQTRPEKLAIDQVGGGTLLFTTPADAPRPPPSPPAIPAGVNATGSAKGIALSWAASVNATAYSVSRAAGADGPISLVAGEVNGAAYTDTAVVPGTLYTYVVRAASTAGTSDGSLPVTSAAGLPAPWTHGDVGDVKAAGRTLFDGSTFTVEGSGLEVGGKADQFQFARVPISGDGTITVRFVPQVASQVARFGIVMRDGTAADAAAVSLLVAPGSTPEDKRSGWTVRLVVRATEGAAATAAATTPELDPPLVVWGRLMEPIWLRLSREGKTFAAFTSPDGQTWRPVGTVDTSLRRDLLGGMGVCSHLATVSTVVVFDHVNVPGWEQENFGPGGLRKP